MMYCIKRYLVLFLLVLSGSMLKAQDYGCDTVLALPWTESFPTDQQRCWIFVDNDSNGHNWTIGNINPFDGYYSLVGTFSNSLEDNWAISQAMVIPDGNGIAALTWEVFAHSNYAETYEVLVSGDGSDITTHFDLMFGETVSGGYYERHLDLSAYRGNTVRIAFRHRSEAQNFICIDNIQVTFTDTHQEPQLSIVAPDSVMAGTEVTLQAVCDNAETFAWNLPGATILSADGPLVTVTWQQAGKYTVAVTATTANGTISVTKEIVVYPKSNTSAVDEPRNDDEIIVYPNPTSGIVTIVSKAPLSVELLDMHGSLLISKDNFLPGSAIDISGYPNGVYLLRIVTEQGTRSTRIIKI